jgi:DNA-binding transcriptional LysR family regulator
MDLRQLTALVAIADHGSFSAAAKALYTVQSNVSAHVARLERELSALLVDRSHGRLTPEGEVVAARARRIQAELDAMITDLASLGEQVTGEARLGMIGTTARWLAPQLLRALRETHPLVRAVLVEASTTSLLPQLVAGQLDAAVVNLPVDDPEVETEVLFAEDLVVLVPDGHPLAEREEVAIADLAAHRLILPPHGTALREDLEGEARRAGVTLRPAAEIDGVRLLTSLAFEGFAPAIVPATAVPGWIKGDFRVVQVPELPRRLVGLARRRRSAPSRPAIAVTEVLTAVVARRGPRQLGLHVRSSPNGTPPAPLT